MINVLLIDLIYWLNVEFEFTENFIEDYMLVYNCILVLSYLFLEL